MNKNYRSIWNEALGAWVAVSEIENAKGKPAGGSRDINRSFKRFERIKASLRVIPLLVCMTFSFSGNAYAAIAFSSVKDGVVENNGTEAAQVDDKGNSASILNYKNPGNLSYVDANKSGPANGRLYSPSGTAAEGIAIGRYANAAAAYDGAKGYGNIAIGDYAQSKSGSSLAFGSFSKAINTGATSIGTASLASGFNALAMMRQSAATDDYAMAIGTVAWAKGKGSLAIGHSAQANGHQSIAIGSSHVVPSSVSSKPITEFDGQTNTQANGKNAIAIGSKGRAEKDDSIAIGTSAQAALNGNIAIGQNAVANGVGNHPLAKADRNDVRAEKYGPAIAIGGAANAQGRNALAIGNGAQVTGNQDGIAVGAYSEATERSLAAGYKAIAGGSQSVALGSFAGNNASLAVFIGTNAGANSHNNRLGVSVGHDAGKNVMGTENVAIGNAAGVGVIGNTNYALGSRAGQYVRGADNFAGLIEAGSHINGTNNIAIGKQAGSGTDNNPLNFNNTIAMGANAEAKGEAAVSLGSGARANAANAIAIGATFLTGSDSVNNSKLPGTGAIASGESSLAIGNNSKANNTKDVALGADSVSEAAESTLSTKVNNINYGNFAGVNPVATVSVGSKNVKRTVTNVAAGRINEDSTDAINGSQLYMTQQALGNVGNSVVSVLGGNANMNENGNITISNIGGTNADTVDDAIKVINEQANKPLIFAGDIGVHSERKLNSTVTIKGGVDNEEKLSANNIGVVSDGKGALEIKLSKELTNLTSATFIDAVGNSTTVNGDGITIKPMSNKEVVSLSGRGLNNGGNKITKIAKGIVAEASDDAVNGSQLYAQGEGVKNIIGGTTIFNPDTGVYTNDNIGDTGASTVDEAIRSISNTANAGWNLTAQKQNSSQVAPGNTVDLSNTDKNILISKTNDSNNVTFNLAKNITVDSVTAGADNGQVVIGKNGVQVGGSTYISNVGLNANDKVIANIAAGKAEKDAVNVSQLTSLAQMMGVDVNPTTGAVNTPNFVVTKADSSKHNGVSTIQAALDNIGEEIQKPLIFGGDNGKNFNRKLGNQVFVKGGATGELSDNNIAVESDGNDTLNVKLVKNLTGLTSAKFTDAAGKTTIVNSNGITIVSANGSQVRLSENGLDNGGNKITNVLAGDQDGDVVNVKQLQQALKDLSVSNLSVVEANSPFSYVNGDGKQLIRKVDKQGQVTFVTAEDNQLYQGNDITIAALNPNQPQTTVATKVGNVAAGSKNTDAVNVSQLTPIARALGMNVDAASGTVAAPSFTVTQANGTPYAPASTVQEALTNVGKEIQKPITFTGNSGQTEKHLGDTLNIQGTLDNAAAASTKNIRTKVDNGVMQIELAERPQFGNLTLNADGSSKIAGLSEGAVNNNSQEAVNGSQLYEVGKGVQSIVGGSTVYNPDNGTFTNNDIGGTGQSNIDAAIRAINTSVGAAWNLSAEGANSSKVASGNTVDLSSNDNNIVIGKTATSDNVTFDLAKNLTGLTSSQFTDGSGNHTTINGEGLTVQPVGGSDAVKLTTAGLNNGGKKVTNIAKGNVSDSSKDAVNGSQLYSTANSIAQTLGGNAAVGADGNVTMSDIGGTGQNTVNEAIQHVAQGFKLNTSNDGGGEVSNNKEAVVKAGETVTVDAGSNIKLTQTGKTVSVATKADVNFNSVVAGTGVNAVTLDRDGVKVNGKTYVSDAGLNANNKVINNVAAGKQAEDAVNVSQLNPIAQALGVPVNPNTGTVAALSWVVTKADGSKYDGASTVQDALNNIGIEIQKPINFAGNSGNTAKRLGETFTVKGGLDAAAKASGKNIRTEVGNNGEMLIELSESPTFGNVVVNAEGSGRIAGVTAGQDDQDAVNMAQLKGVNKNVGGNMQALGGSYDPVTNTYTPPSFATKSADGQAKQSVNTVQEALANLNDEIVKPITFSADEGQNSARVLGSTMAIKAGNFNGAASADNLITSNDGNGTITIKLADAPTFKGKVSAVGLDAGNQKITGIAEGEQDRDAVNMAQLKRAMEDIIVENQTLVEANSPFSYVNSAGEQLVRKVDPDGTVHFEKAKDKTKYDGKDIFISALNAVDPQTATPTRVTNLAKGTANTDAVAVSQLRDTIRALGGEFNEADGSITDPVYEIQRADGTTLERVGNVKDALTKLNSVMQDPITITGNTNQGTSTRVNNGSDQKLGSVLSIRGASVDGTASADNVRTVVSDNQVEIQLADAPTFKGKLSAKGLDAGGEKITNVGAGENPNDVVNKSQLDEVRTLVGDGWNISANAKAESKVVPGNKVDFNNADSNIVISKKADSHNVTFDLAENINIGKANPISINGNAGTIGGLTNTTFDAANPVTGQAATEDQLAAVANTPLTFAGDTGGLSAHKLGSTVTVKGGVTEADKLTDNNIGVVSDGNGTLEVKLAKNIRLGADGSLAAGDTVVNNDGVSVGNDVALTADGLKAGDVRVGKAGIDAGNKTISNVADAENDTDAVNLKQLKDIAAASSNKVAAGKNVEITPEKNADGSTTYKVATKDEVEFTRAVVGSGENQVVLDDSGVNVGGNTYISARGLDANNQKVSNVAAGNISAASTDAVNGSQLFNAGQKVADALGGGSKVDANGNVTAPAYALTGGNPAKGESKTYNNVGEALNGLDQAVNQPLTFAADSGSNVERKLGSTFNVNGDNSNIRTETTADGVKVALNDRISVKQVQVADGPTINNNGIAMNNQQITGLKSGLDGKTIDQIKTEGSSSAQWNNAATVGDLASVQNTVTNITNVTNNILGTDDGKGNSYTNNKGELTEAGKLALKTYDVSGQTATNDNTVISAIKNMNEGGIKYFHTNDDSGQTTGGVVHDTDDSSASGKFATAVGFNAAANSENALAIGKGAKALAENALAIGTGNVVSGRNSGAIGDPSTISGNNSYSLGNNNTVATDNTFVLGNSVAQTVANSVVLGNESAAVEVHKAVAGSSNYTYKGENDANVAGVKDVVGVVSVGKDGQTRQIQNVAAGVVSATSTDAINGSQLYYTNKAIEEVKGGGAGIVQYSSPANPTQPNGGTASNDVTLVGGNPNAPVVIHNVGAGSAPTDAVNVGQLMAVGNHLNQRIEDTGRRANAGTASAMAMAGLPQAYLPGKSMVAVAGSTYRGESGYALGVSSISDNGNWIIKGTASGNSRGHYGATAGVGYQW